MDTLRKENERLRRDLQRLVEKVSDNQRILEHFQVFELELLACQSITDLLNKILKDACQHFELAACRLIWWDPQDVVRELLDFEELQNFEGALEFINHDQLFSTIYRSENPVPFLTSLGDTEQIRWFPWEPRVKSCAVLPLIREGRIFGSLHMASASRDRFTPEKGIDFMSRLAAVISLCVESCVNQEHLRRLGMIDRLTKVENRRSFDQNLTKELSRASRSQTPLSCLFIDLDHFKHVNDTFGHQAGDQALKNLAQVITQQLRQTDHLARYGGEEFAALLPDCDRETAVHIAERIRLAAQEHRVECEGMEAFGVTLSIGSSTWYPESQGQSSIIHDGNGFELVARADSAVYEAKRRGRNRVCFRPFEERSKSIIA